MADPRPPLRVVQRVFWTQIAGGASSEVAAMAVGVAKRTGQRWFGEAGGMAPLSLLAPAGGRYLDLCEREQIAAGLHRGSSLTQIAAELGRSTSTVAREVKAHMRHRRSRRVGYSGRLSGIDWTTDWHYSPTRAQHAAEAAASRARAKNGKLATHDRLRAEVTARLGQDHSPEQIARRLREDFPEDPEMWVSHETIYQALYVQGRGALKRELTTHLRTGRSLRKPRKRAEERRARMAGMVMISDRPAEVEDRAVPGHWEGDLVLGSIESGSAVGTLVERTTRFVMLLHLPGGHTAEIVQEAMVTKMATLPEHLRRSLTWDQGTEMARHTQIVEATGLSIYFCDPHSPWQRGTNENTNGLLRQYLPKGTDLSFYGPGLLDHIADQLNQRPRKTLNWRTPAEALNALLSDDGPNPVASPA